MDKDKKDLFEIWRGVKRRCGKTSSGYEKLNGKYKDNLVSLDERWEDFEEFYKDVSPRTSPRHSLDRIDNTKGYSAFNCKWSSQKEQNNNKSDNVFLEYRGKRQTMMQWAEELKVPFSTLMSRIEKALDPSSIEKRSQKIIQIDKETDEKITIYSDGREASSKSGVSQAAIRKCLCGHNKTAGGFKWKYLTK